LDGLYRISFSDQLINIRNDKWEFTTEEISISTDCESWFFVDNVNSLRHHKRNMHTSYLQVLRSNYFLFFSWSRIITCYVYKFYKKGFISEYVAGSVIRKFTYGYFRNVTWSLV